MLNATEVADLRTDIRLHHQNLNDLKREAINIVTLLDDTLHEVDMLGEGDHPISDSEYELLSTTRDLAHLIYARIDAPTPSSADVDPSTPEPENDNDDR